MKKIIRRAVLAVFAVLLAGFVYFEIFVDVDETLFVPHEQIRGVVACIAQDTCQVPVKTEVIDGATFQTAKIVGRTGVRITYILNHDERAVSVSFNLGDGRQVLVEDHDGFGLVDTVIEAVGGKTLIYGIGDEKLRESYLNAQMLYIYAMELAQIAVVPRTDKWKHTF